MLHEIFKYHMNHVQTSPCFSILSLTKLNTDLWPATRVTVGSVCIISGRHLLSTQKSGRREQSSVLQQEKLFPSQHPTSALFCARRSFQQTQAFLRACVFMIMILSCVHKHTSPKCFPSCVWNSFHLCFICSPLFLPSSALWCGRRL